MSDTERVKTPAVSIDAALWIATLPIDDIAYIHGAAFVRMAMEEGVTEAALYADFAKRAANDPDANKVHPR